MGRDSDVDRLDYIDSAAHEYASCYLRAFHDHAARLQFRFGVTARPTQAPLRAALADPAWRGLNFACAVFEARVGGRAVSLCIDSHDSSRLDTEHQRHGYHWPLLNACDLYFKVNHDPAGIRRDPQLTPLEPRIVPVARPFPLPLPAPLIPRLGWWPSRRSGRDWAACRTNLQLLRRPPAALDDITAVGAKDIDVFYVTTFRQGARHSRARDDRNHVVDALREAFGGSSGAGAGGARTLIGFASDAPLPGRAEAYRVTRLPLAAYARTVARSRIFVYTRGLHDCLSSKMGFALAAGTAVVGHSLVNRPDWQTAYPHLREQFAFDEPSAIVERVRELLARPEEVGRLAALNREFFRRELHPGAIADQVLGEVRERVSRTGT